MPRVFPSQIAGYLAATFKRRDESHLHHTAMQQNIGAISGFIRLYDQLPHELLRLREEEYAELVAAFETVRFGVDQFRLNTRIESLYPISGAQGALATVWKLIETLPDEVPATSHDLAFIGDPDLREMVQLDISAISVDLQSGEWQGATIFAGSCCETLLLYALQTVEARQNGSIASAVGAIKWGHRQSPDPLNLTGTSWNLSLYSEVSEHLKVISTTTRSEVDRSRDYRNLIHPAKAIREQVTFDRGTAFIGVGALEHVIRDLRKNL
jgi:hypothetical protein